MLLNSAGRGSSRLGGIVQKGVRALRKVLRIEKNPGSFAEPEQSLARFSPVQPSLGIASRAFSVVSGTARGVLLNHVAKNQVQSFAADMRRRYAFRLMSGSTAFCGTGRSSRALLYGFVGISFGGFVQERFSAGENGYQLEHAVRELFENKPQLLEVAVSEIEEDELSVVPEVNVSDVDSEISVLDDDESDFEILVSEESFSMIGSMEEADQSDQVGEEELIELLQTETQQTVELAILVQQLCQQNEMLKKAIAAKEEEDILLQKELLVAFETIDIQQRQLVNLQNVVERQNSLLKSMFGKRDNSRAAQLGGHKQLNDNQKDFTPVRRGKDLERSETLNFEKEKQRLDGCRGKTIQYHRKQRLKVANSSRKQDKS